MEIASEIAMELTIQDCAKLDIEWQSIDEYGNSSYTEKAQNIFNNYYDELI